MNIFKDSGRRFPLIHHVWAAERIFTMIGSSDGVIVTISVVNCTATEFQDRIYISLCVCLNNGIFIVME